MKIYGGYQGTFFELRLFLNNKFWTVMFSWEKYKLTEKPLKITVCFSSLLYLKCLLVFICNERYNCIKLKISTFSNNSEPPD